MLRSLFSGMSGIKNEQAHMDVIANNISNVNTVGFKQSRITFAETFVETLEAAKGVAGNFGGSNPIQIGRGASIASIDTNFNQGNLESTGITTDLALNGNGFFVVSDGSRSYYTRNGAFQVDSDGNMMTSAGFLLQGRLADSNGILPSTTTIQDIVLPFGEKEPAKATENISFKCNLNKNASSIEEWLGKEQLLVDGEPAKLINDLNQIDGYTMAPGDKIEITGTDRDGNRLADSFVYGKDGTTLQDLVDFVNTLYSSDESTGATMYLGQTGQLRLVANQAGENDLSINFAKSNLHKAQTEVHTSGAFTANSEAITLDTDIKTIDGITDADGNPIEAGDFITISGTNPNGNAVSFTFTYGTGEDQDGIYMQDLLDKINSEFTGIVATLSNSGEIVITDESSAHSMTHIEFSDGTMVGFESNQFSVDQFSNTFSTTTGPATLTTNLNDLSSVTTPYEDGDKIIITGSRANGESITFNFVYDSTDSYSMEHLINKINEIYDGITASLDETTGKLVIQDNDNSDDYDYVSFAIFDDENNVGSGLNFVLDSTVGNDNSVVPLPSFSQSVDGMTGTHSTSITVYDSLGNSHDVRMEYTQDPTPGSNKWYWEVIVDEGKTIPTGGNTGSVTFNEDGSLNQFETDGNAETLTFNVEGGDPLSIKLNPGTYGTFDGITQTASSSTNFAEEQDGYTMGVLEDLSIDDSGVIVGIYSNGRNKTLAQIAVAQFTNEMGLSKESDGVFSSNKASGSAKISWAGDTSTTNVKSGYLESSNVDLTDEFSRMIISQRALQANAKIMTTSDEILNTIIQQIKR